MVTFIQAVIFSILQGITEWFAISSSGHLAIAKELLNVSDPGFMGFVVYLHFASVLGVLIFFWKDIINLFVKKEFKYMMKLIISLIPVVIAGVFLKKYVESAFGNLFFIGIFYLIAGFFIYSTKYAKERKTHPSISDSLFVGFSQILAIFPGISRSGMATGSGLILGLKKDEAIKFSFLLAIPIVFGAAILDAGEISHMGVPFYILLTSFTLTLLTSLITIKLLVKIVKINKFYLFGIYNFLLGIIVILWSLFG
jgi:undecaprenyl-diphosphatase